jgi:hypothetical protein
VVVERNLTEGRVVAEGAGVGFDARVEVLVVVVQLLRVVVEPARLALEQLRRNDLRLQAW